MDATQIRRSLNPRDAAYHGRRSPFLVCLDCQGEGCEDCDMTGARFCEECAGHRDERTEDNMAVTLDRLGSFDAVPLCFGCAGDSVGVVS